MTRMRPASLDSRTKSTPGCIRAAAGFPGECLSSSSFFSPAWMRPALLDSLVCFLCFFPGRILLLLDSRVGCRP